MSRIPGSVFDQTGEIMNCKMRQFSEYLWVVMVYDPNFESWMDAGPPMPKKDALEQLERVKKWKS